MQYANVSGKKLEAKRGLVLMEKKGILDKLYYDYGKQLTNFRCCCCFKYGEDIQMTKWKTYLDFQSNDWFIKKINLRQQLNNELILDYDDKKPGHIERYKQKIKHLDKKGYKFFAFMTKEGRSKHIHIYDIELAKLKKTKRERLREKIILGLDADVAMKSDNHLIQIEFSDHWKTGQKNDLIFSNKGGWFDS